MKRFDTFGEYMFDLLFAPLKKGKRATNQFLIFFRVIGRDFDDLKAAIFRVRSESNIASCSEAMLPVHGQDRNMPRLAGEDTEAYRTRLSMKAIISQWSGTRKGILYALTALGYGNSRIESLSKNDPERWAEFAVYLKFDNPHAIRDVSVIYREILKVKEGSSKLGAIYIETDLGADTVHLGGCFSSSVRLPLPEEPDNFHFTDTLRMGGGGRIMMTVSIPEEE